MENNISQSHVADSEDVARMLFSPLFIDKGKLSPTAFALRVFNNKPETYISVLRTFLTASSQMQSKSSLPHQTEFSAMPC